MYNIILVDDEKIIREGLLCYFESSKFNFKVVEVFEDGSEALEYLRKEEDNIHVVITDIRMSEVSGLELAKVIKQEKIDVITILLSGYQEFEFARQAIANNVFSYLLKPVKFHELDSLFSEIQSILDKREQIEQKSEKEELSYLLLNQVLVEADAGTLRNKDVVENRLRELKISTEVLLFPCSKIQIKRTLQDKDSSERWGHGIERLDIAIMNILRKQSISYYKLHSDSEILSILALPSDDDKSVEPIMFYESVNNALNNGFADFRQIFDFDINLLNMKNYSTLLDFSTDCFMNTQGDQIERIKQLLITDVASGDLNALECALSSFITKISNIEQEQANNILVDFYQVLKEIFRGETLHFTNGSNLKLEIENAIRSIAENAGDDSHKNLMERAIKYIYENYHNDIAISDVASYVYLSPMYFGRVFKEYTGEKFSDYLIEIRISKAKQMLHEDLLKIQEISEAVGYSNPKYFNRIFKKRVGVTPGEYRRKGI